MDYKGPSEQGSHKRKSETSSPPPDEEEEEHHRPQTLLSSNPATNPAHIDSATTATAGELAERQNAGTDGKESDRGVSSRTRHAMRIRVATAVSAHSPRNDQSTSTREKLADASHSTQSIQSVVNASYTESPRRSGLGGKTAHSGGFEPGWRSAAAIIAVHDATTSTDSSYYARLNYSRTSAHPTRTRDQGKKKRILSSDTESIREATELEHNQDPQDSSSSNATSARLVSMSDEGSSTQTSRSTESRSSADQLITEYRDYDVLFGRSKTYRSHSGNQAMQLIVDIHRAVYDKADRDDKTEITRKIVEIIKAQGSRFLKYEKDREGWSEVPDEMARRKVGHAMRDGRTRPLTPVDPKIISGIPFISDDIKKAVAQMASLTQQDAQNAFGTEEADILVKLLSAATPPSSPDEETIAISEDERKPRAKDSAGET